MKKIIFINTPTIYMGVFIKIEMPRVDSDCETENVTVNSDTGVIPGLTEIDPFLSSVW